MDCLLPTAAILTICGLGGIGGYSLEGATCGEMAVGGDGLISGSSYSSSSAKSTRSLSLFRCLLARRCFRARSTRLFDISSAGSFASPNGTHLSLLSSFTFSTGGSGMAGSICWVKDFFNRSELVPVWLRGEIGDLSRCTPRLWLFGRPLLIGLLNGLSPKLLPTKWSTLYSSLTGDSPCVTYSTGVSANEGVAIGSL